MHLYLIRHGKTTYNIKGIMTGWIDASLSKEGIEGLKEVRNKLKNKKIDIIVSSDLKRSIDTAKYAYPNYKDVEFIIEPKIRERDYGYLAGKSKRKEEMRIGKLYHIYHRSYYISPPAGESFKMVEQRVLEFFIPFMKKNLNKHVLLSAHGNSLRVLIGWLEQLSVNEIETLEVSFGKIYEYHIKKEKNNYVCHIIEGASTKEKTHLKV